MPGRMITIKAKDGGSFQGFLAVPDSGKGAGVVVIQEIFGVNFVMREICHALAAKGYFALAPDLFWRQEPSCELSDKTEGEWGRAFKFYQGFNVDKGVDDIAATIDALRKTAGCTGKIGATGYCLGGKLSYLTATRTSADCSVGYYGVSIEELLGEATNIKTPHMQHIAEKDKFVPPEAQAKIKDGLKGHKLVTLHSYAGCDHAFARIGGEHYDAKAAALANQRTYDFFNRHLG
ncbi:MAG: dienelactone hydrolase family protein [Alphaproteobacteria bacterium]|nr:dienelactone hydrolase family protein [Alphaproteobacteria bacterium]